MLFAVTAPPFLNAAAIDPARQAAPADGWAGQAGGTAGGSAAISSYIYTVNNRAQLLAALNNGGNNPKIIKLVGTVDMSEGVPYANTGDQAARGLIRMKPNTTLIGDGAGAGIVNGHIQVTNISQVIIRNLKIVAPCDVGPIWDPNDGATGNWNSAYDAIAVSGADHVWVDHVTFTDVPVTDNLLPIENGKIKQCHDGALDITNASDYVTASYNVFTQHHKTNLVGSSDSASADEGKLRITFSNNVFRDVTSRSPRVRYGQVHLFNNYFVGSKSEAIYGYDYSVGAGYNAKILSNANVFEIAGTSSCGEIVKNPGGTPTGAFKDTGSLHNGAPLAGCTVAATAAWTPPYAFSPRPAGRRRQAHHRHHRHRRRVGRSRPDADLPGHRPVLLRRLPERQQRELGPAAPGRPERQLLRQGRNRGRHQQGDAVHGRHHRRRAGPAQVQRHGGRTVRRLLRGSAHQAAHQRHHRQQAALSHHALRERHQLVRRRHECAKLHRQHPGGNRQDAEQLPEPAQAGEKAHQHGRAVLHRAL
jgi:pectate lyase